MMVCPKCDSGEIKYMAKYLTDSNVEIQCICGECGNVFRAVLDHERW